MLAELNIQLAEPGWLLLAPGALLLMIILYKWLAGQSFSLTGWLHSLGSTVYRHPLAHLFGPLQTTRKYSSARYIPPLQILLLLLLFSLALAQPYRLGQRLPDPPQHRDVIFLLDTSVSMVLRDYVVQGERIDRLTMLKNVLLHFVDELKGNRIQFIAYAEQAYTLVPLTNDYDLLKFQLQRLQPASLTGRGSDLSKALLYALQDQAQITAQDAKPVFVMLTDASRPAREVDPRVVAAYIAQHGIRLHTITIGAGSYAAEDDKNTTLIYHPASFQLLEEIASKGNGRFFWARDPASLRDALQTIQAAEKRNTEVEPVYVQQPLYFWPLGFALVWLVMLYAITLLRREQGT